MQAFQTPRPAVDPRGEGYLGLYYNHDKHKQGIMRLTIEVRNFMQAFMHGVVRFTCW
jgi:hypothetical protein